MITTCARFFVNVGAIRVKAEFIKLSYTLLGIEGRRGIVGIETRDIVQNGIGEVISMALRYVRNAGTNQRQRTRNC